MDHTTKLGLPYIVSQQAQKHVTHNEALRQLDAMIYASVQTIGGVTMPPSDATAGQSFIVADAAEDAWLGQAGAMATWVDGAWLFSQPNAGWLVWAEDEARLYVYDGTGFVPVARNPTFQDQLGINAQPDAINRLAVSSPASLFDNRDGGHQLVVNKAHINDTASVLFQSTYTGHAEMGLAGDDIWRIKVSADGNAWQDALTADPATAQLHAPAGLKLGNGGTPLSIYDEGVFAPALAGSSITGAPNYTVSGGRWTRIGNLVTVNGRLVWSALGGLRGYVTLTGLPFNCRSGLENRATMTSSWYNGLNLGAGVTMLGGFTEPGADYIRLWGAYQAQEGINRLLNETHVSESGEMSFSCVYMAE